MAQVSWRADDALVERVRRSAAASGRSLNEFVTVVLDVATDPARAGTEAERVRERLRHAGLLELPSSSPVSRRARPTRAAVEAASRRAAKGTSLATLVSEGR
jgi:hypothetical protein